MDYKRKVIIDKVVRTFLPPIIGILPMSIPYFLGHSINGINYSVPIFINSVPIFIFICLLIFQYLIIMPRTNTSIKKPLKTSIICNTILTFILVMMIFGDDEFDFSISNLVLYLVFVFVYFEHYWLINFSVIALLNRIRNKTNFYTNWSKASREKSS